MLLSLRLLWACVCASQTTRYESQTGEGLRTTLYEPRVCHHCRENIEAPGSMDSLDWSKKM